MASLPTTLARFDGTPEVHKLVQDRKRDLDHRSKYANGAIVRGEGSKPNQRAIQPAKRLFKTRERNYWHNRSHPPGYGIRNKRVVDPDTSLDDMGLELPEVAADAEIAYSFDNAHGPTQGRDILGLAVTQAVERFETKEMEKLVKNEYDVLGVEDYEDEEDHHSEGFFGDDDFELI